MAEIFRLVSIFVIILAALFVTSLTTVRMTGSYGYNVSGGGIKLTVWDDTDSYGGSQIKYTYPTSNEAYPTKCLGKLLSEYITFFYANYTNSTSDPIDSTDGNCTVRFDSDNNSVYESWFSMGFNSTTNFWEYNRSFTYKGVLNWQVSCTSSTYENLTLTDNVTISNTAPCTFALDPGNYLPSMTCQEDTACTYDFSKNITDDDANDALTYSCDETCFPGFSINPSSGIWTTLVTNDAGCGQKTQKIKPTDNNGASGLIAKQNITITAVNDAPAFTSLPTGATEDAAYTTTITATDEESNTPYNFSISIMGCNKAFWVTAPQRDNCTLFYTNQTSGTVISIRSFTPTNWDVGSYTVNYTVTDSGTPNATYSEIKAFTVTNVNDRPSIGTPNSTNITINQGGTLYLLFNGTDIENDTLTFTAVTLNRNLSSYSNSSLFPITTNNTNYPNESAQGLINISLSNGHVGNFTLNVTVTDNGTNPINLKDYILINLTVLNVNDPPALANVSGSLQAIQGERLYYTITATDPDFSFGENLTFGFNFTQCETLAGNQSCNSFEANSTFNITKTSTTTAQLFILADRNDTGNYTMNVTVTDSGGLANWTTVNLTIVPDWPPDIHVPSSIIMNQTESFWLEFNITDTENNTLNISYRTLYRNLTIHPLNLFPVNVSNSTYPPYYNLTMNYTPVNNSQVGNYTLEINATDTWNRTAVGYANITVWNVNDQPEITNFTSCYSEGTTYPLNLSVAEGSETCLKLRSPDPDLLTPYGDILDYTLELENCSTSGGLPPGGNCSASISISKTGQIGVINFTAPDESWQGNYTFNLTIVDSANATATKLINFSIYAVNDAPVLIALVMANESSNWTEVTHYFPISGYLELWENVKYNLTIISSDEENNVPYHYNATFKSCQLMLGGTDCTLFSMDENTSEANISANASRVGNYTINFTVRDSGNTTLPYNATGWSVVNLTIQKTQHTPTINLLTCLDCDVNEGDSQQILFSATDIDNESLTCFWYLDGELRDTVSSCNGTGVTYDFYPSYDDACNVASQKKTLMLIVRDPTYRTTNKSANLTINDVNRAPRLVQNITSPIKWASSTSITAINLDNNFQDDCGETLDYTFDGAAEVDVTIDAVTHDVTLRPKGGWFGTDWVMFTASDSLLTAQSNNVTLDVEYQPPIRVPSPVSYEYRPKKASLSIILPEVAMVRERNVTRARVVIHNDGGYDLFGIRLTTFINTTNITLSLVDESIGILNIGANFTTWLNIFTGDLDPNATYVAVVTADVASPPLTEAGSLAIKVVPKETIGVEIRIVMVKDMFEENPECMELFGLITRAEESLNAGNMEEAKRLTQLAIDNCQDMIDYARIKGNHTETPPPGIDGRIILNPLFVMGFAIAILILAMLGFWLMSRNRGIPST